MENMHTDVRVLRVKLRAGSRVGLQHSCLLHHWQQLMRKMIETAGQSPFEQPAAEQHIHQLTPVFRANRQNTNDCFNYIIPLGSARARTTRNNACVFPFVYKGRRYTSCSRVNSKRPWCAITPNYDVDKLWGYCRGRGGEDYVYLKYQKAHRTAFCEVIEHTTVLTYRCASYLKVRLHFLLVITKFFYLLREPFSQFIL